MSLQHSDYHNGDMSVVVLGIGRQRHSRHGHWEEIDDIVCIERLHDIARNKRLVDARVLVSLQLGQLFLPYVHHRKLLSGEKFVGEVGCGGLQSVWTPAESPRGSGELKRKTERVSDVSVVDSANSTTTLEK